MIIAHRGGKPENTLEAFSKSTRNRLIDGIEFDIRLTHDKDFVIVHDDNIDGIFIETLTVEEIKKIDPTIPTLKEALNTIKTNSYKNLHIPLINIEIKTFDTSLILAKWLKNYIEKNNDVFTPKNFIATSFLHTEITKMHTFFPDIHYGWILRCWPQNFYEILNKFPFIQTLVLSEHCVHIESLNHLKSLLNNKIAVWIYTINNYNKANFLISLVGVDGIITDIPDEILQSIITEYPSNH